MVSPQCKPAPAVVLCCGEVGAPRAVACTGFPPALAGALALRCHHTKPLFTGRVSAAERRSGGLVNPVKKTNSSWAAAGRRHWAQRLPSFLGRVGMLAERASTGLPESGWV